MELNLACLPVDQLKIFANNNEFFVDTVSQKLRNNNVFTIAKRNVEGQDMLYQSLKLTNGIWILAELKIQPGNPNFTVSFEELNLLWTEFLQNCWSNIALQ